MWFTNIGGSMGERTRFRRIRKNPYRDTRLLTGAALVLGSTLVGGLAFAMVSSSEDVLVATTDIAEGDVLTPEHFAVAEVRMGESREHYVQRPEAIGEGAVARESIARGELLPRAAVGQASDSAMRPVTIQVAQPVTSSLRKGALVDVWASGGEEGEPSTILVEGAIVRGVDEGGGLSGRGARVEVLVPASSVASVLDALGAKRNLYVVEAPGLFEDAE